MVENTGGRGGGERGGRGNYGFKKIYYPQVYFTPDTLDTYIGLTYDSKIDPAQHRGTKPDDVVRILSDYIPPGKYKQWGQYRAGIRQLLGGPITHLSSIWSLVLLQISTVYQTSKEQACIQKFCPRGRGANLGYGKKRSSTIGSVSFIT